MSEEQKEFIHALTCFISFFALLIGTPLLLIYQSYAALGVVLFFIGLVFVFSYLATRK